MLKAERELNGNYKIYVVNNNNERIRIPKELKIYNDHKGANLEKMVGEYYNVNNTDNYSIFYREEHIMDFSHNRLWDVKI